jgi:hypothetical protein
VVVEKRSETRDDVTFEGEEPTASPMSPLSSTIPGRARSGGVGIPNDLPVGRCGRRPHFNLVQQSGLFFPEEPVPRGASMARSCLLGSLALLGACYLVLSPGDRRWPFCASAAKVGGMAGTPCGRDASAPFGACATQQPSTDGV